jgi:teichuronic acid exporter
VIDNNLKQKFTNAFMWSVGDKLVSQVGFILVHLYIARLIGPESFGLISMLLIFMLLADSVVNNGFSQALIQRSHSITEADSSTIFYVSLIWGIVIYLALYATAPLIASFYREPELAEIVRLLFLIIIFNSLTVVVRAKLLIKMDFKSQAIASFVATILSSSVAIYLVNSGYDYWAYVWLLLLKALIQNIFIWLFCYWHPRIIFSYNSFRKLFRFGSNLMVAGFVATLVNNLYLALIGRYYNATNVGYFSQAIGLTDFLSQFISTTLQGVTYPLLTSIKEQKTRLNNLYRKLINISAFISFPIFAGLAAISDTFVLLFLGEDWTPIIPIIQVLCIARSITPINIINMNILNAIGRSNLFLKIDLSKLPITLGTLFLSIGHGIYVVAWALVANVFISFFINSYFSGKLFGFGAWKQIKTVRNYIFSSMIMFTAVRLITFELLWLDLILSIMLGVTVYTSLMWFFKDELFKEIQIEVLHLLKKH